MHLRKNMRPYAVFGAALVGAGAILTPPAVVPALSAHAIAADVALTALDWPDVTFWSLDGGVTFDSTASAEAYVDQATTALLTFGQTAAQWGEWLDPFFSFVGISGIGDWVSGQYDLIAEILSPGWEPETYFVELLTSVIQNPGLFFGPVVDVDLGWFYGLLGITADEGNELDGLLELASGFIGGGIALNLMNEAANLGLINAVIEGDFSLDDLFDEPGGTLVFPGEFSPELFPEGFTFDSYLEWVANQQEVLMGSIENAIDILEGSPTVQWIIDIVSQFADFGGFALPF